MNEGERKIQQGKDEIKGRELIWVDQSGDTVAEHCGGRGIAEDQPTSPAIGERVGLAGDAK